MPTAKSYENYKIMGEPYSRDGKMYVIVQSACKRCGGSGHYSMNASGDTTCYRCHGIGKENLEVRWYTDSQRASMDKAAEKRKAVVAAKVEANRVRFAARNAFGFGKAGFITLIWGDNDGIQEWRGELPMHTVLYNNIFGWYIPSEKTPDLIPERFSSKRLDWTEVRDDSDTEDLSMKEHEVVRKYVYELKFGASKSEYQGEKDSWLEKDVTITKNIPLDSQYGLSHMHVMEDEDGNVYVWTTASKNIEENTTVHMHMKVKDHKEYNGIKQTVVYYCKEK